MSAVVVRSTGKAPPCHGGGLFRCRLMSRSDVKRAQRAGRNQNRTLMRGGRA